MPWERARQPEQKEERKRSIVEAAESLIELGNLESATMTAIARAAGISKANVYRYFESREEILMTILLGEQGRWVEALIKRLDRLPQDDDKIKRVARAFASTLGKRPKFCLLAVALPGVVEHNISCEAISRMKKIFLSRIRELVTSIRRLFPQLTQTRGQKLVLLILMTMIGIWPHCNPPEPVQEVLKQKEFASLRFKFEPLLREVVTTYFQGYPGVDA